MVEVDPFLLLVAGSAIVGMATVAVCMKSTDTKEKPIPTPAPASKPKKRSRSKKNKGTNSATVSGDESGMSKSGSTDKLANLEPVVNSKQSPQLPTLPKELATTPSSPQIKDTAAKKSEDTAETDSDKKGKKAKETAQQKTARLERQKLARPEEIPDEDDMPSPPGLSPVDPVKESLQDSATVPAAAGPSIPAATPSSSAPIFDGWAVVEDKRKLKVRKESSGEADSADNSSSTDASPAAQGGADSSAALTMSANEESTAPAAPVVETVSSSVTVEARKLGLLIGPKGVTKIGMQTATGTEITMPKVEKDVTGPVDIVVSGPAEGVKQAVHALNELCSKGYCNLLADADFHEGYVAVPPRYLPDIIGKGGSCIKAIQNHTGVKISTPSGYAKVSKTGETTMPSKVKISLAGSREKVTMARNLILDLTKYYHTPVTHPGVEHLEMDIPGHYFNYIIGSKGSEIKHIQANYKVNVHIPNGESMNENLLIVGAPAALSAAQAHIQKIIDKVDTAAAERAAAEAEGIALGENAKAKLAAAAAAAAAAPTSSGGRKGAGNTRDASVAMGSSGGQAKVDHVTEPDEPWMSEFTPRSNRIGMNLGAMLPTSAKFSNATTVSTTTAAEPISTAKPSVAAATEEAVPVSKELEEGEIAEGTEDESSDAPGTSSGATAWGGMAALPSETW